MSFSRKSGWRFIGWGAIVVAIWPAMLNFPDTIATDDQDLSWGQALGHFFSHSFQAGVDYIFSYGPLGYFSIESYDAKLFTYSYWWNILLCLVFAIGVVRLARHSPSLLLSLLLLAVVVVIDLPCPGNEEDFYRILILAMALPLLLEKRPHIAVLFFSVAVIAVISQVKFTFFALALLSVLCAELHYRSATRYILLSPLTVFAIAFASIWLMAAQHLANIPRYLYASQQVLMGYVHAMVMAEPDPYHVVPILAILVCLLAAVVALFYTTGSMTIRRLAISILLFGNAWIAWKHGVTRADSGHLIPLPGYDATLLLLVPIMLGRKTPTPAPAEHTPVVANTAALRPAAARYVSGLKYAAVTITFLLSAYASFRLYQVNGFAWSPDTLRANLAIAAAPGDFRAQMEDSRADLLKQFDLPKIKAIVGADTIDMVSCEQGVVLLNGFNYQPRPMMQSLTANNHFLIHENGRFFASDRAPNYVLYKSEPIDTDLTATEDSECLLELARRYIPVTFERGFCLLRHVKADETHDSALVQGPSDATVKWGQAFPLPDPADGYQTLSVHIRPSLLGNLRTFFYKEAEVYIALQTTDGDTQTFRLIPSIAEDEFLLNPLIEDEVGPLYIPSLGSKIASLTFTTADPRFFEKDIAIELKGYVRKIDPALADQIRFPMMVTIPSQVNSPDTRALPFEDNGEEVLMVTAPSELRFNVQPGSGSITGEYGILPGAYPVTEGVTFNVSYQTKSGVSQTLFERTLDPHNKDDDKGLLKLDVPYQATEAGQIVLSTSIPPGKAWDSAWSCWTQIDLQPSTEQPQNLPSPPAAPSTQALSAAAPAPDIRGSLDEANGDVIGGWCWDRNRKDDAVNVEIFDGDTLLTSLVSNIRRPDLVKAGIGDGSHCFRFDVPQALKDGRPHVIHARSAGVELKSSPRTLICPPTKH